MDDFKILEALGFVLQAKDNFLNVSKDELVWTHQKTGIQLIGTPDPQHIVEMVHSRGLTDCLNKVIGEVSKQAPAQHFNRFKHVSTMLYADEFVEEESRKTA